MIKQNIKCTPLVSISIFCFISFRFFNEMGGGSSKTTVNYLISLIDRVHKIYEDTVWSDKPDGQGFSGMGFIIKKIVVHRYLFTFKLLTPYFHEKQIPNFHKLILTNQNCFGKKTVSNQQTRLVVIC